MRLGIVLGTRPEVLKNASIVRALRRSGSEFVVLHTGQHHDPEMRDSFFEDMGYRADHVLPGPYRIGRAIDWIEDRVRELKLDTILVNGDTAAALVGAIAAQYAGVRLARVEAGLRSDDPEMHEERNRIAADTIAHDLFAYTAEAAEYLRGHREVRGRVHLVGNTTVDLILDLRDRLPPPPPGSFAFVTLHRAELTERPERLHSVLRTLSAAALDFDRVLFPVHPRTQDAMHRHGLRTDDYPDVEFLPPIPAAECLAAIAGARVVITDSGCIQEEAYLLGTPCVTVRENTERPETLRHRANVVAGFRSDELLVHIDAQARSSRGPYPPVYGEPGVGARIIAILERTKNEPAELKLLRSS